MRFSAGCVGGVLALAAQGACDEPASGHKTGSWMQSTFNNLAELAQSFEPPRLRDDAAQAPVREYIVTRIVETTVTESYPRITYAPIMRRKLGSNKWDIAHDAIQGRKRDASICPSDYQLCPQSLNGGCCPTDRACGTSSCLPSSTGPAACGTTGYSSCGADKGGGCCPDDYSCQESGCVFTPAPNTESCGTSSYACPASFNYGCCANGMACGPGTCYSTNIVSLTVFDTFTTTSSGHVKTVTSKSINLITPTLLPANTIPINVATTVQKLIASTSAVDKVVATSSSSGGLTKPQIGGIIAGAVIILVVLLVIGFLILCHLNKVKKAIESNSKSYRSYRTWSQSGRSHKKSSKRPNMEAAPSEPVMAPSDISKHIRHPSEPSPIHAITHEMEGSPPQPGFPFSPNLPTSPQFRQKYASGYAPVATSEPPSPPLQNPLGISSMTPTSDSPMPSPDLRDQNLRFGHLPHVSRPGSATRPQHERQWSEDSNVSGFSQASSTISESDAGKDRSVAGSSSQHSFYGFRWIRPNH